MTDETTKMSGGKKAVIGMIAALLILTAAAYGILQTISCRVLR